jgi:hypothetical protein
VRMSSMTPWMESIRHLIDFGYSVKPPGLRNVPLCLSKYPQTRWRVRVRAGYGCKKADPHKNPYPMAKLGFWCGSGPGTLNFTHRLPVVITTWGLGGPARINIHWDWLGPAGIIGSFGIGWAHYY